MAKIKQSYQKGLAKKIEESITEFIEENNSNNSNVETGNLFCQWILYNIFDLREDEVLNSIEISGKEDNGVDAVFEHNGEICILQSKYNNAHNIDSIHRFISDCKRVVKEPPTTERLVVKEMLANVRDQFQKGETINCYYVTNAEIDSWHKSNIKSELKTLGDEFRTLNFQFIDFSTILENFLVKDGQLPKEIREMTLGLSIQNNFEAFDTIVAMVRLRDFAEFVNKGGNLLFHSNIRNHIKGSKINRGIKYTLENEPDKFWFYNNGITIVGYDFHQRNGQLNITAPQIVNGCQTAKSIGDYFKTKTINELSQINSEGQLLIKVIRTKKSTSDSDKKDLRDNITRYTNRQNAVKGLDFYALDQFQQQLQQRFKEYGYFYEIQRGSFISKSPSEKVLFKGDSEYEYLLEKVNNKNKYVLTAKEVIQSFTAGIILWPNIAYGRANDLTPNGDRWQDIMNEKTKDYPLEHFLFPFLVLRYAKEVLKYKTGPTDFRKNSAFLFVATYYLFILTLFNQLNEKEYDSPAQIDIEIYKVLFSLSELNQKLMRNIHEILRDFFKDSQIKSEVGDNLRGFLQNKVNRPRNWDILKQKIVQNIEDLVESVDDEEQELYEQLIKLIKT